jgi:glucokinase-like ROK family protein
MTRAVQRIIRGMRSRDSRARKGPYGRTGADLHAMREYNRLLVLNCVRTSGPIARVVIARQTGLSRTTISTIMEELLKDSLVREGETSSSTSAGGRPATLVHFNDAAGYVIGVDMGRSHLTLLLTDLSARVVARRSGPFSIDQGPDYCLPRIGTELHEFLEEQGVAWSQIVGIGMGIPGPLDGRLHKLISPPRMPGWNNVEVLRIVRQQFSVPVYIENDANMGAIGESRYGAGRGMADLAYVKIGTGIGAGLVIGGQLYRGSRGSAGEIGHVSIDEQGPVCDCGNRGCLETVASADAVVADARTTLSLRRSLGLDSVVPGALSKLPNPDIADVVEAARHGDPASRAAIAYAGERIGIALASLVNLINPSLILVDGAVARAGEMLLEPIHRAVAARSLAIASHHARVAVGELGDNAIAFGGVAMVLDAAFGSSVSLTAINQIGGREAPRVARHTDKQGRSNGAGGHGQSLNSARDPPSPVEHVPRVRGLGS